MDEANAINERIKVLENEISTLNQASANATSPKSGEALLAGKTAYYQHDNFPDFTTTTVFNANGKATVTGVNLRPDDQVYEESSEPGMFHFWSEKRRTKETGWTIRVHPSGKSATVENLVNGHKVRAQLKYSE
ncbi:hypothetical protein N9B21_02885 [Verrucomicrobiales bacterium]|nr:hypothetical protein [Verrucomicrobiales bacterium]MDA7926961.1 hypothetical protein [Verrucomicrobiales bacterium]